MDLLPFGSELPLHRLVGAVHLFGIPVAGYGLAVLLTAIQREQHAAPKIAAAVALAMALLSAAGERFSYVDRSVTLKERSAAALRADGEAQALLQRLITLQDGRVYLGIPRLPRDVIRIGDVPLGALALVGGVDTLGYLWHAMAPAGDVQVWFDPDNEVHCRTFGVRYLVFEPGRQAPPFARLLEQVGRFRIYEVPTVSYLGVADVPGPIPRAKGTAYTVGFKWLSSALPAASIYPRLEYVQTREPIDQVGRQAAEAIARMPLESGAAGTVTRLVDRWSAEVITVRPAAVVLRSNYHPRLTATVNGRPSPVFPVAPSYAAVAVPAGAHQVTFRYTPERRWPWLLGGIAGAVVLIRAARMIGR